MYRNFEEIERRGNFILFYHWAEDEYELQHVGIGTLLTLNPESFAEYRADGETVCDAFWNYVENMMFDHFATVDGAGQRAILRRIFSS